MSEIVTKKEKFHFKGMKSMNIQLKISMVGIVAMVVTLLAVFSFTSCNEDSADGMYLYTSVWIFPGSEHHDDISISFSRVGDDRVSFTGFSGVNYFSGSYKVKGRKLKLESGITLTKMAGPSNAMEKESEFIKTLSNVTSFSFVEGERRVLMLHENDKTISGVELNLADKVYEIFDAENAENNFDEAPYILFADNNLATVFTGVNYVEGVYVFIPESSSFEFVSGLTTLALGSEEENKIEDKILDSLSKCETFFVKGNEIELSDENGNLLLILLKK